MTSSELKPGMILKAEQTGSSNDPRYHQYYQYLIFITDVMQHNVEYKMCILSHGLEKNEIDHFPLRIVVVPKIDFDNSASILATAIPASEGFLRMFLQEVFRVGPDV